MKSLKSVKEAIRRLQKPAWDGPCSDTHQGGITQSLLSRYLVCKERFRLLVIKGYKVRPSFSIPLHYGQMWHTCEEALADNRDWLKDLKAYCRELAEEHPNDVKLIMRWFDLCKIQFPVYIRYWKKHPDVRKRKPLLQEVSFKVPYELPSGRVVYLRGKWDSVDQIGREGVYLQENKSKGKIDEFYTDYQLQFDMQTMIYVIALQTAMDNPKSKYKLPKGDIAGIRYNVIRRPLAGGLHSIRQRGGRMVNAKGKDGKPIKLEDGTNKKIRQGEEDDKDFYNRLEGVMKEHSEDFFYRWRTELTRRDLKKFKDQFLDPCLEELCDWYYGQTLTKAGERKQYIIGGPWHYRLPYGVYNSVMEGRSNDIENYLLRGSMSGLQRTTNLFPEL